MKISDIQPQPTEEDLIAAVSYFKDTMEKLFGDNFSARTTTNNFGPKDNQSAMLFFHDKKYSVTWQNSRVHIVTQLKVKDDGVEIKLSTLSSEIPIKFRKITAKNPMEAVKKLVDWFSKNKKQIDDTFSTF